MKTKKDITIPAGTPLVEGPTGVLTATSKQDNGVTVTVHIPLNAKNIEDNAQD